MMDNILNELEEKMENAIAALERNFATVRTGRANPKILDKVVVNYYGSMTPLNQLATVSAPESRLLSVKPFDKGALQEIEKAINESNLGLTPNNDGQTIRINIPQLTEERRKEFAKQVKSMGEEGKIALRNSRHEAINKYKSEGLSEDEIKAKQDRVQNIIDKFNKMVDEKVKQKEEELLQI